MSAAPNEYIISGGQEGKSRLNVLSEVLQPYTRSLLVAQGLSAGTSLLDAGCGGGNVAIMAAGIAGATGSVTAIDFDATIISLAMQDVAAAGIHNISFSAGSAYDLSYHSTFDMAYARFLLSHLGDPMTVLQKMVQSVKPGGRVVVEDIQFSGHFCYPACNAFTEYVRCYTLAAAQNGQNAEIGPALFSMFHEAGLGDIGFDTIQPCCSSGPGKQMACLTLDKIKDTIIRHGIATDAAINDMLLQLRRFTDDEHTIISLPRIFRVWGTRK